MGFLHVLGFRLPLLVEAVYCVYIIHVYSLDLSILGTHEI